MEGPMYTWESPRTRPPGESAHQQPETTAISFLSHGVPCLLICVPGMHCHLLIFAFTFLA